MSARTQRRQVRTMESRRSRVISSVLLTSVSVSWPARVMISCAIGRAFWQPSHLSRCSSHAGLHVVEGALHRGMP